MKMLTQILNDAISNFNEIGESITFLDFTREILTALYSEPDLFNAKTCRRYRHHLEFGMGSKTLDVSKCNQRALF